MRARPDSLKCVNSVILLAESARCNSIRSGDYRGRWKGQSREGQGGLLASGARATRGLRRPSLDARSGRPNRPPCQGKDEEAWKKEMRKRPGALFARRAPTMKRWSLDARSKGQPWPLPYIEVYRIGRPSLGLLAHLGVPVGGRVRKLRAVGGSTRPPSTGFILPHDSHPIKTGLLCD